MRQLGIPAAACGPMPFLEFVFRNVFPVSMSCSQLPFQKASGNCWELELRDPSFKTTSTIAQVINHYAQVCASC